MMAARSSYGSNDSDHCAYLCLPYCMLQGDFYKRHGGVGGIFHLDMVKGSSGFGTWVWGLSFVLRAHFCLEEIYVRVLSACGALGFRVQGRTVLGNPNP